MERRNRLGCFEAGNVISAVDTSIRALVRTDGSEREIKGVARRLVDEVGWPEEVAESLVEAIKEDEQG